MMENNIVVADFSGGGRKTTVAALWQHDYGQILKFSGIDDLPVAYEVHFSNEKYAGNAKTQIGNEGGVTIPDEYFLTGRPIYAWLYLHTGENDGETVYQVTIPINKRSRPADTAPTPVEQSVIDQAIAALNVAVEATGAAQEAAESAQGKAETAQGKAEDAQAAAESARAAAEAAEGGAVTAKDDAVSAKNAAVTAKDDAVSAKNAAAGSASGAAADALKAEGYALGKQSGTDVGSSSPYYHANAKYYKEQADADATAAGTAKDDAVSAKNAAVTAKDDAVSAKNAAAGSASGAAADALKAEGYALGKQSGTDVGSGSPYYHNNAKYFKEQAASSATAAGNAQTAAETAQGKAETAQGKAEAAQGAAETAQGKAEDAQAGAEAAAASLYGVLLDGTNTTRVFWQFWTHYAESATSKFDLLCQFMRMLAAAWSDKKYTLRYLRPEDGSSSDMTPLDDLADKSSPAQLCTDQTAPVTDWADEDPMTWYIRANAESLADGTMNITYLEGEQGFDLTGETLPVYTFSLALWLKEWTDGDYNYKSWTTIQQPDAAPYPGDVGVDGKKRDLTWHPTFDGSYNSTGKLTSGVGGKPANRISASSGIAKARLQSAYDALWGDTDTIWALHTWQLRHWNLENSGICEGCQSYSYTYTAAVSETGVRRVLVTTAQGANLQVGSNIMVGTNASTDRGAATSFSVADNATILSKETVYVNDVAYCALNLDTVGTFDVTAGTTQIITAPWSSGNTELLPDRKDGACHSLTAGQNPFRLQGVEFMTGAYVIGLDPLYNVTADATSGFDYHVYECRDATKQASSITADYVDTGIVVTGIASGWNYVKRFVKTVLGVLFPDMFGGSSTTYFKSAFCGASSAGVRCPWRFGSLYNGGTAGLACENGYNSPGYSYWYGRLRLSGSGKTRGEWAA